jgi:AraC-like DNA-binding protein
MQDRRSATEPLLSNHPLIVADGVEPARRMLSHLFNAAFLEPIQADMPLKALANAVELPTSRVAYLWFERPYVAGCVEPLDFHTVQLTRSGASVFTTQQGSVRGTTRKGVVLSAGDRVRVQTTPDNGTLALIVKDMVLRDLVSGWIGRAPDRPIRFAMHFDPTAPRIASFLSLFETFVTELNRPGGILEAPAALASFEHTLITAMLFGLEHNLSDRLRGACPEAGAGRVREIEQYLEAHAAEPVNMATLARDTGHSIHSIYRAFYRHRHHTPMEFLRKVRMRRARACLLQPPPHATVTGIATQCGFAHLGRFAAEYKQLFGESPSHTLERAVGPRLGADATG